YPSFEFLHGHGLGVLQVGTQAMPQVAALCGLRDSAKVSVVRKRFSLLGERWLLDTRERLRDGQLAVETARLEGLEKALQAAVRASRSQARAVREVVAQVQHLQSEPWRATSDRDAVLRSDLWRATSPLRYLGNHAPLSVRQTLRRMASRGWWPLSLRALPRLREWNRRRHAALLITASSLFDARWYTARYPDVAARSEERRVGQECRS